MSDLIFPPQMFQFKVDGEGEDRASLPLAFTCDKAIKLTVKCKSSQRKSNFNLMVPSKGPNAVVSEGKGGFGEIMTFGREGT